MWDRLRVEATGLCRRWSLKWTVRKKVPRLLEHRVLELKGSL